MVPEFKKLAKMTKNVFGVAAINVEKEGKFINGITNYPTILVLYEGQLLGDYSGERTAVKIFNWSLETYQNSIIKKELGEDTVNINNIPNKGLYDHNKNDNVVRLFGSNFAETIKEGVWLVEFYTPWCSHCKILKTEWVKLAKSTYGNYNVASLNMDTDTQGINFFVDAYPTIFLYYNGKKIANYTAARTAELILEFTIAEVQNFILTSFSESDIDLTFDQDENDDDDDNNNNKSNNKSNLDNNINQEPKIKNLIELDHNNYNDIVTDNNKWLIIFIEENCGPCDHFYNIINESITSKNITETIKGGYINMSNEINEKFNKKFNMLDVYPNAILLNHGELYRRFTIFNSSEEFIIEMNKIIEKLKVVYEVIELSQEKYINNIKYKSGISVLVFMPIAEDEDIQNCDEIVEETGNSFYNEYYNIISFYRKNHNNVQYYWIKAHKYPKLQMKLSLYSFPCVVIVNYEKKIFSVMKKQFSSENTNNFISSFLENKNSPKIKKFDKLEFN